MKIFVLMHDQRFSTESVALCFDVNILLKYLACLCKLLLSLFFQSHVFLLACLMSLGRRGVLMDTMSCLDRPGKSEHLDIREGQFVRKMSRRFPAWVGSFTSWSW